MTYVGDMTWAQVSSKATAASLDIRESTMHAREAYEEWIKFANGRDDATIATALTALQPTGAPAITAGQVADLRACYQGFLEADNFAHNVAAPLQGDRFFLWRKFS
jgi:hypothetical protein